MTLRPHRDHDPPLPAALLATLLAFGLAVLVLWGMVGWRAIG